MPADQPAQSPELVQSYPPSAGNSQTGLWIAVIGVVVCLLAISVLVVAFGVGRWMVARVQEENAIATVCAPW
ncbi:MAG: hypothetical protein JXB30_15210 [Anaerolineae bacterium]|nr:hypothetical protein [Anaerolineae bacterium]